MPRENSFSDSEGRSLTPDPEDEDFILSPASPTYGNPRRQSIDVVSPTSVNRSLQRVHVDTETLPHHKAHPTLDRIKTKSRRSLHSHYSKPHPSATVASGWSRLTPREKWQAAGKKIMSIRRGMTFPGIGGRIGAEPGVDPRRPHADATFGHLYAPCEIEVIDYSSVRCTTRKMTNAEFAEFLDLETDEPPPRPSWAKVRWINIGGISWDVLKPLAIKYELHPLAFEDVVKNNPRTRSKADYYSKHLFLRVLCHQLAEDDPAVDDPNVIVAERSDSPEPFDEKDEKDVVVNVNSNVSSGASTLKNRKPSMLPTHHHHLHPQKSRAVTIESADSPNSISKLLKKEQDAKTEREKRTREEASLKAVKHGDRVEVEVTSMFMFLFRDGTVISVRPQTNLGFTEPIAQRLRPLDTVLRKAADPSLLIHALLDLTVDRALQVIDQYHANINKYEKAILLRPKMKTVRQLHILDGDLILHKRTLEPIKTLIYGLRRYDLDRCAALIDSSDPANKNVPVVGFMSHKSKIYLADVYDHMEYILSSVEMFSGIAENLIDYTFNIASYEMNEVMRRLTLATIIFLPMTVLTGYFGMNFDRMWSVQANSDLFFWYLAIPILVLTFVVAMSPDIKKALHYVRKKAETKEALKTVPRYANRR